MFNKKEKPVPRFELVFEEMEGIGVIRIMKDTETGVSYLILRDANVGTTMTPLIDHEGKIVIDKR